MDSTKSSANVLLVGDVAGMLGLGSDILDTIYPGARVTRTVLRSEALRMIRSEPLDIMLTSSSAAYLMSDEFLAALSARAGTLVMLVATRRPDPKAIARFQAAGVHTEQLELPIDEFTLHQRIHKTMTGLHERAAQAQAAAAQQAIADRDAADAKAAAERAAADKAAADKAAAEKAAADKAAAAKAAAEKATAEKAAADKAAADKAAADKAAADKAAADKAAAEKAAADKAAAEKAAADKAAADKAAADKAAADKAASEKAAADKAAADKAAADKAAADKAASEKAAADKAAERATARQAVIEKLAEDDAAEDEAAADEAAQAPEAPLPRIDPRSADADHPPTKPSPQNRVYGEHEMANINKSLEEAMKIDGAIATAIADWESGLCLGTAGGNARLNIEIAAAGNCQVVKAKMATMSELGIKGTIHDILITLDDQVHLIRPLRHGENLFIYVAIDKAKGNLGMARHRLQKIEADLNI